MVMMTITKAQKMQPDGFSVQNSIKDQIEKTQVAINFSLYRTHDLLLLLSVLTQKYDITIHNIIKTVDSQTRQGARIEFEIPKSRLKRTKTDFFINSNIIQHD